MTAIPYRQVRPGTVIVGADGQPHLVVGRDPDLPAGDGRAELQLRLKSLATGGVAVRQVHPDDPVEEAPVETSEMQYVYRDGDGLVFMDPESCDHVTLTAEWAGALPLYLKEGVRARVVFHAGRPLRLEPPAAVELTVTDTDPPAPGTAAAHPKAALLETGLKLLVPAFINVGETIVVDARSGTYVGRAVR